MKNLFFLVVLASLLFGGTTLSAQAPVFEKYRRSSLHLVLLKSDIQKNGTEVMAAWSGYPFPDKYDRIELGLRSVQAGKPKMNFSEMMRKYDGGNRLPSDPAELNELKDALSGKKYIEQLRGEIDELIAKEKIANQLLAEWFNIRPDGSYNMNRIQEKGCYNASMLDALSAQGTARGKAMLQDAGAELIGNTFVSFSRLDFYENEPVARFTMSISKIIASQLPEPAGAIAVSTANAAYALAKDGSSAYASTFLYRLAWNDSIEAEFYNCFINDRKIDYAKFMAKPFRMEFVGVDQTASTVLVGIGQSMDKQIQFNVIRNIDKLFAKMQKNYDVFRPKVSVLSNDEYLTADIGMKEGLSGGERFELLEPQQNPSNGRLEYKKIATVTATKGLIWDNRYNQAEGAIPPLKDKKGTEIMGTVFSKNKSAVPGMLLRQAK